jgi:hypothetical protein
MKRNYVRVNVRAVVFVVGLFYVLPAVADSPENQTHVNIEDSAWLAGHWIGDGFGGTSEEVWTKPVNGVMMGMFRLHDKDGKLVFYEFLTIDDGGLTLKHFHPGLKGWETKDEVVTFKMVETPPGKIILEGLRFEKKSEMEMHISLSLRRGDVVDTEVFHMKRVSQ